MDTPGIQFKLHNDPASVWVLLRLAHEYCWPEKYSCSYGNTLKNTSEAQLFTIDKDEPRKAQDVQTTVLDFPTYGTLIPTGLLLQMYQPSLLQLRFQNSR